MLVVYSSLYLSLRPAMFNNDMWIFNTPDETANYYFIQQATLTSQFQAYEPLNELSGDLNLVHPRSTTVVDNYLMPGSLLGFLLIMRLFARIFSLGVVPVVIPILSVITVIYYYKLIRLVFTQRVAFYSALSLYVLPAFWYYSSRSLFNNLMFIDLLIIGLYYLISYYTVSKSYKLVVSAILLGLALTVRTTDLIWVVAMVFLIIIFNYHQFKPSQFIALVLFGALAFVPVLAYQQHLYGNPLTTGYTPQLAEQTAHSLNYYLALAQKLFLPFGLNLKNIGLNVYHYGLKMFWWYLIPAIMGACILLVKWFRGKLPAKQRAYCILSLVVCSLILLSYGSWWFYNNLMAKALIGSSQVRYFLPIYILSLPFMVSALISAVKQFKFQTVKYVVSIMLIAGVVYLSVNSVLFQGEESLTAIAGTISEYHGINKQVRQLTEHDAVIVSSYNDKVFFPKRKVIVYWRQLEYLANISQLSDYVSIYLYSINPEDVEYVSANSDLYLDVIKQINQTETLYQFKK